jgi:hypothetical protein
VAEQGSRSIHLALNACNLIEEIDPPDEGGLVLRRSLLP